MHGQHTKLALGENHRRVLSVVLRSLEQMCEEIEGWLERKPGLLFRVEDDLSPRQRRELRQQAIRLRGQLRRLADEIALNASVQSPRRAIAALLSSHIVQLEETTSERLRGYGVLSEEARQKIDAELAQLIRLTEQMLECVERG